MVVVKVRDVGLLWPGVIDVIVDEEELDKLVERLKEAVEVTFKSKGKAVIVLRTGTIVNVRTYRPVETTR